MLSVAYTRAVDAIDLVINNLKELAKSNDNSLQQVLIMSDLADLENIKTLLLLGDPFYTIIEKVMNFDTLPRENILEAFKRHGLKDLVEATKLVKYL